MFKHINNVFNNNSLTFRYFVCLVCLLFGSLLLLDIYVEKRYNLTLTYLPSLRYAATIALIFIVISIISLIVIFIFQYKNKVLSYFASALFLVTTNYIYGLLANPQNVITDDGIFIKNRIITVTYNPTWDEKMLWVKRLQNELNLDLNILDDFVFASLQRVSCFNDFKYQTVPYLREKLSNMESVSNLEQGSVIITFIQNHPIITAVIVAVVVGMGIGAYLYFKNNNQNSSDSSRSASPDTPSSEDLPPAINHAFNEVQVSQSNSLNIINQRLDQVEQNINGRLDQVEQNINGLGTTINQVQNSTNVQLSDIRRRSDNFQNNVRETLDAHNSVLDAQLSADPDLVSEMSPSVLKIIREFLGI